MPITKDELIDILNERDIQNMAQIRDMFQSDLQNAMQGIENKTLLREKDYAETTHKTNIILERLTSTSEQLYKRTERIFNVVDNLKDIQIPEIRATQDQQRGAMKLWGAILATATTIGGLAGLIALLK